LGLHSVRIVLHPEVFAGITANVAQSTEEAEMQAKGIDPLRLRDEEETQAEPADPERPSGRREEGDTRAG